MARLAIRATGDKSTRENVTVGENDVRVDILDSNKHTYTMYIHKDKHTNNGPTLTIVTPHNDVIFTNEE